jgi:Kef-type K+ transport system membrane component KefB/Trk K+ transport system NAD-binding subunit
MHMDILSQIAIAIVVATVIALIMRRLKQPVILGYIAAGILIGPTEGLRWIDAHEIEPISELGLILLLFMIGLEIDLKKLRRAGTALVSSGIGQFIICVGLGLLFWPAFAGKLGGGRYTTIYLSVAAALSSTMIVVKLLYDKFELDTAAGRFSLGILVFQDIWAILFLALQKDLANPAIATLFASIVKGVALVVFALAASWYVLPKVFRSIAKMPELMVMGALAWCFGIALVATWLNLSREMGALIAGISLSTFPYNVDVVAKVVSLRDFFITLFFVTLGAQISRPDTTILAIAAAGSLFIIATRLASVMPILYATKAGTRTSLVTALNLSQISEFALVICTLGVSYGHISDRVLAVVVMMLVITSVVSTYLIQYNYEIYDRLRPVLRGIGMKIFEDSAESQETVEGAPIIFLGFTRVASSLLHEMLRADPAIARDIAVIDFNPAVHDELTRRGIRAIYGDISHADTLAHAGVADARVLISTVPDSILKGTTNAKLLAHLRSVAERSRVIVTSERFDEARHLYATGAAFVFIPRLMSARDLASVVHDGCRVGFEPGRRAAMAEIEMRSEVLA